MPRMTFNRREVQTIIRRYENGERMTAIAESFGCTSSPIRAVLVENGIVIRARGWHDPTREHRDRLIRERRQRGWTLDEIARSVNLSRQRVHAIVSEPPKRKKRHKKR